jgi:hypothetical protein
MSPPTAPRCVVAAAGCALLAALTACRAPATRDVADEARPLRVMVKLVRGSEDAAAIGVEASRIAGVRVTHAAATSREWHALALHCGSGAECDDAVARLRAAHTIYRTVEIEGRKVRSLS